jgi:hypothetical protein
MLENIRKTVNDGITELIAKGDLTAAKLLATGWHDKRVLTDTEYEAYIAEISRIETEKALLEEQATNLLI